MRALAQAGLPALTYEFFAGLTDEIERQEAAGDAQAVEQLTSIRSELLQLQEQIQEQTRQVLGEAESTLEAILSAEDRMQALQANINKLDDAFMYVLSMEIARAEQEGDQERLEELEGVRDLLVEQVESQTPPEIQFLNQLVRAASEEEMEQLIEENMDLVSPDLVAVVDALQDQAGTSGQSELVDRLLQVKRVLLSETEK